MTGRAGHSRKSADRSAYGHYIENLGPELVVFPEMFRTPHFAGISFTQWMANIPPQLPADTVNMQHRPAASPSTGAPLGSPGRGPIAAPLSRLVGVTTNLCRVRLRDLGGKLLS